MRKEATQKLIEVFVSRKVPDAPGKAYELLDALEALGLLKFDDPWLQRGVIVKTEGDWHVTVSEAELLRAVRSLGYATCKLPKLGDISQQAVLVADLTGKTCMLISEDAALAAVKSLGFVAARAPR